jgi:hypothetical protein
MKTPEDVTAMARLKSLGWGARRIAVELGCSKNTVKRWLREGAWRPCSTISRSKRLDGLTDWLSERFRRHCGNADVIRQGRWCFGKTPMQTLLDSADLAREKQNPGLAA